MLRLLRKKNILKTQYLKYQQASAVFSRGYSEKNVKLPSQAEIVIAGGGVIGTSVAYHLAEKGWKNILILEQGSLGGGTSWHAAGLVGSLRSTKDQTMMCLYARNLYEKFEEDIGVGWKQCGSLYLAQTDDRVTELKRKVVKAKEYGIDYEIFTPQEIQAKFPINRIDDLKMGVYLPDDGMVNPTDLIQAYQKNASKNGATTVVTGVEVEKIISDRHRITGVETNHGHVNCDYFINCAGLWAREVGLKSEPRVDIPLHASEHFYIVTKPLDLPMQPVTRDLDAATYSREWNGGLLCGVFESNGKPTFYNSIPENFEYQLLEEDWDHFAETMEKLVHGYPILENAEIRTFVNGPESFTPDCLPHACKSIEFENYYIAAGMCSGGIVSSAGIGQAISEMLTHSDSSHDVSAFDVRRVPKGYTNKLLLRDNTVWSLRTHYELMYPYLVNPDCRNTMNSPLHSLLENDDVRWTNVGNWEIPLYFKNKEKEFTYGLGKPTWLSNVQTELNACEDNIGIIDFSSKTKFNVRCADASQLSSFLSSLCLYDVSSMNNGDFIDNVLLSKHNGCQATFSLAKVNDNKYTLITSPEQHNYAYSGMYEVIQRAGVDVTVEDISGKYACIGLLGDSSSIENLLNDLLSPPHSTKDVLPGTCRVRLETGEPILERDVTFYRKKPVSIGYASNVQLVNHFVNGIKGWQMFVPSEFSQGLYRLLMEFGQKYGIQNVGHVAFDSYRIQHGVPMGGKELNQKTDPDFIKALYGEDKGISPLTLVSLEIPIPTDKNWIWGGEPILLHGEIIGHITSVGFHSQSDSKLNALTLVRNATLKPGDNIVVQCGDESYEAIVKK